MDSRSLTGQRKSGTRPRLIRTAIAGRHLGDEAALPGRAAVTVVECEGHFAEVFGHVAPHVRRPSGIRRRVTHCSLAQEGQQPVRFVLLDVQSLMRPLSFQVKFQNHLASLLGEGDDLDQFIQRCRTAVTNAASYEGKRRYDHFRRPPCCLSLKRHSAWPHPGLRRRNQPDLRRCWGRFGLSRLAETGSVDVGDSCSRPSSVCIGRRPRLGTDILSGVSLSLTLRLTATLSLPPINNPRPVARRTIPPNPTHRASATWRDLGLSVPGQSDPSGPPNPASPPNRQPPPETPGL